MRLEEEINKSVQALSSDNGNSHDEKLSSCSRFSSLLASKDRDYLLSPIGSQVKVSDLEGKVTALYFSANWYPPCRNFTQILVGAYEELKSNGSGFEIVFVSSDEDLDAFNNYRACMPWLAIPFSDLETKKALNRKFDIEGVDTQKCANTKVKGCLEMVRRAG